MDQIIEEIKNEGVLSKETIGKMSDDEKTELLNGYLSIDNTEIRFLESLIKLKESSISEYEKFKERAEQEGKIELAETIGQEIAMLKKENEKYREKISKLNNEANKEGVNPKTIATTSKDVTTTSKIIEAGVVIEELAKENGNIAKGEE